MTAPHAATLRICLIYAAAASAWIVGSDLLTQGSLTAALPSIAKGLLFVAVSATLLYGLIRRIGYADDRRFLDFLQDHPTPGLLIDPQAGGRILDANPAAAAFYGWSLPELRQMRISDINTSPPALIAARMQEAAGQRVNTFHFRHRLADGSSRDVRVQSGPVLVDGRELLYSIVLDETEALQHSRQLHRQRDLYAAMAEINAQLLNLSDAEELLRCACRIAVDKGGVRFAWIGRADWTVGKIIPIARSGRDGGYIDAVAATLRVGDDRSTGPTGSAARLREPRVVNDFLNDPSTTPWHERARSNGLRASAAFPITLHDDVMAVFNLYADEVGFFDAETVELFQRIADAVSLGLLQIRRDAEARQSAEAKELADHRWREALDAAGHGVWDWDAVTNRVFYSSRWKSMLGYDEHDIGDSLEEWRSRVHPDDLPEVMRAIEAHTRGDTPAFVYEHRLRCKDGSWRWVLDSGRVVERDALGSPARLVGTHTDMTRWHSMEALLDQQSAVVQALTEQPVAGVATLRDGRTTLSNATLAGLMGRPLEELQGVRLADMAIPGDRERAEQLLAGKRVGTERLQFRRPTHESVVLDVHASPVALRDGGGVVAVFVDASDRARMERERADYLARIEQMVLDSVDAMSQLVELRDPYTAGHERRVGEIAAMIAAELGHDREYQRGLRICGAVHDIGKISVPSEILTKPGRLTPQEYALVQQHCRAGHEVLSRIASPWPLADVALQHHERWDGSGYPQGLAGEAICREARITAVADVIESMASHRPYRAAQGLAPALAEIERGRGTLYDPAICDAALRIFRDHATPLPT